jgi:hypothetical protein
MSPSMKDLLTDEVRDLPTGPIPVESVISDGRRRLWRHRVAGGAAACAAFAALGLLAPSLVGWSGLGGGDGEPVIAGSVDRAVAYSTGSTIHSGHREIDVSPHIVLSFVQTDDGFVFVNQESRVYFTDGATTEQIGDANGMWSLAADDTGSYVGWVEVGLPPEFVVYDTSTMSEVLRTSEGNTRHSASSGPQKAEMEDIDGDVAYVHDSEGVVAWNLTDGTNERIVSGVGPSWLWGVADGQIAHVESAGGRRYVVVSDDPQAEQPRVRLGYEPLGAKFSPSGRYVVTLAPRTGEVAVSELPSGRDVTPDDSRYVAGLAPLQWVDDDSFYTVGTPRGGGLADVVRCWIATGKCQVVAGAVAPASQVQGPSGENAPIE